VVRREPKIRQMIATFAYKMCLGAEKLNKAVIKLAVSCKACATADQTFPFQSHGLTWKKWSLKVNIFYICQLNDFHKRKKLFLCL
jgi:hypothetical protein